MDYINEYLEQLYLLEEIELIEEVDLKKVIQKISPKRNLEELSNKFKKISKQKPKEMVNSVLKLNVPSVKPSQIDSYFSKKGKEYKRLNKKAETVIKNSLPEASPKMVDAAATYVTVRSFLKMKKEPDNLDMRFRENVKNFISDVRERDDEVDEKPKMPPGTKLDYVIGLTIIWSIVVALGFWIAMFTLMATSVITNPIFAWGALIGLLMFVALFISKIN